MIRDREATALADRELELVESHIGLAALTGRKASANGFADPAQDEDDAIQDAAVGLLQAAKSFDESKGASFATHAFPRMRGQVADARRSMDPAPRSVRQLQAAHRAGVAQLRQELGRDPTHAEIRAHLRVTAATEAQLLTLEPPLRIDADMREREDGTHRLSIHELIPDESAETDLRRGELREALELVLPRLSERAEFVIRARYFLNMTLGEIGEVYGVTESRISQIEQKALRALRSMLEDEPLAA